MTFGRLAVLLVVAVQLMALIGCSKQPDAMPEPSANMVTASWGWPVRSVDSTPGISSATIDYGTWNYSLVFAVWLDREPTVNHASSKQGTNSKDGKWEEKYWVSFAAAPEVKVECVTTDGRAGSLTVNGKSLDLAQGNLVLVSTAGGSVRMKQLQRDTLGNKPGQKDDPPACFTKLKSDRDVIAFFATQAEPEETIALLPTYFLTVELPRIENSTKNWNDATRLLRELPCAAKPALDPKTKSWIHSNWNRIAQGPMNVHFPFAPTGDSDLGDIAKTLVKLGGDKNRPVVMVNLAQATPIEEAQFSQLKTELASAKGIDWAHSNRSRLALDEGGGAKFNEIRTAYKKAGIRLSDGYEDK